jgi:PsbP
MRKLAFILACFTAMGIDLSSAWAAKRLVLVHTHRTLAIVLSSSIGNAVESKNDSTAPSIDIILNFDKDSVSLRRRREFCYFLTCGAFGMFQSTTPALAEPIEEGTLFRREAEGFRYECQPPPGFIGPGQKPLKTHLDEVNFQSPEIPGYQIGITVDPVRISSLAEFGTAEQVAAKVVLAEVNRDGVLEVKLLEDPISGEIQIDGGSTTMFYQLNYLSSGKRGNKRNIAKFYVQNQKLFALTAQCKEENYDMVQGTMLAAVRSFRVL